MCAPGHGPRGQALVLREWIVMASPVRVNIRVKARKAVGTAVTVPAFSDLRTIGEENERMVDLTGIEPVTS